MAANELNPNASAGHKLGQLIGDWFEEYFVLPLLTNVAKGLRLYLDCRFQNRSARGEKILWADEEGNSVDYDFVMELEGSDAAMGVARGIFRVLLAYAVLDIPRTKHATTAANWRP